MYQEYEGVPKILSNRQERREGIERRGIHHSTARKERLENDFILTFNAIASSNVRPFTHSVATEEDAIADPQPNVLKTDSTLNRTNSQPENAIVTTKGNDREEQE